MTALYTPEFRVSYPNVFKPKRNELNGKDEYSLVALFPKGADLTELKKAAHAACVKKWGPDKNAWPQNMRSPFRNQKGRGKFNPEAGKTVMPAGYVEDAIFITLRSNQRPGVVDRAANYITDESQFYSGCWAKATVSCYAYQQKGNAGVAFGLGNIQKTRDDDPLGSRTRATDDFAPMEGLEDAGGQSAGNASDLFG